MKPDKKSYSMHNKVLPKIVHIKGEDTIVIEVKQVWIETMPKYKVGHKRFPRFPKTKMVTTKQNTVFENNFKINKTFLKIFKHYELSETSGKLTCLHKTFRHFRKGNSKLYCMSQPNITCADFELFEKTFSTCAWLRYNLPFFPFKTNYMQSDLKRWLMSRWQSFLLPMNIPAFWIFMLPHLQRHPSHPTDERQEWKKQRSANIFLIYVQLCVVVWISWK